MTRTSTRIVVLAVALTLALSGVFVAQGVAQEAGNEAADNGTAEADGSLSIASLTAPESAAPGSTITVAAQVENPSDSPVTEQVEYRFGGQVFDTELVTVEPGESEVVQFTANTSGYDTGQQYHGVFSAEDGQVAPITLSESFVVENVSVPDTATVGDEITVEAQVSNPNDFETNQSVAFRLAGQVVAEQRVTIDAGATETVTADVATDDLESGDYVHGVFTREDGEFLQLTLEAADEPADETETEEPVEETETEEPAEETETEEPVEETETEEPVDETETEEPVEETETEEPVDETETEEPVEETETEEPADETETEEPADETETEEPVEETETEEPVDETETEEPVDETETEEPVDETETEEPVEETETEAPVDETETAEAPSASVTFPTYNATSVTVDQVTLSEGGFVAIHNQTDDGATGPVIGVSDYLEAGTHENVEVRLFEVPGTAFEQTELTENQTLVAMPHLDTNGDEEYDFVETDGAEDGPYTEDGEAVTDEMFVVFEDVEEPEEPVEETETEEPVEETETEEPVEGTETEEPVDETATEEPMTETEEPVEETATEEPMTETEEPVEETATEEPMTETEEPVEETETEEPADETETEEPVEETENEEPVTETEMMADEPETESPADETEAADGDDEAPPITVTAETSVAFENQTAMRTDNATTVTIESVTVRQGGFVAIHNESLVTEGDAVGSVVGVSEYLESGTYERLNVTLYEVPGANHTQTTLTENETLIAMPHRDTNGNGTYDFVATEGAEDGPYTTEGGDPIVDNATVAPADEAGEVTAEAGETTAATENETESTATAETPMPSVA